MAIDDDDDGDADYDHDDEYDSPKSVIPRASEEHRAGEMLGVEEVF